MIYQYSHRLFPRIAAFLAVLALAGAPLQTTAADPPHKISIAEARTLPLGTVVTVAGSVTTPSGAFESSFFDKGFALQDHTAGIYISLSIDLGVAPRRRARVTGTLQDSFGLRILAPADPDEVHLTGHGPPIQPKFLHTSAIGEATEGLLVKVVGAITQPPVDDPPFGFKFFVDDGSGEVQIFVNVQTDIDVSGLSVGQLVSVTGFSSQFETHYEIDPRSPADIVVTTTFGGQRDAR
jgi:hypothetical protein